MEFLDSLILGSNTPRYADEALFPSRTYKKLICNRKHCNTTCASKTLAEFEFWAYFLSEKKPNRREVRKKIHTISKDLRFSIWAKCSGSRERHMELKPVGPHDPAKAPDTKDGVNDHGRLDDRDLVRFILDMCRSTEDCSQEAIFNILKNLERDFPIISNHELLALFIMHVLELPYASPQTVYCLIYSLMKSHNFCSIFSESKKSDEPAEDNDTDGDIVNKADPGFWKALISEHSSVLDQMIDLLLCYEGADIASVPLFLREQTGGDNLEEWVRFMSMRSNLERLGSVFESNKLSGPVEVDRREETYFDFLVIQNEAIKAQETMRMEVSERLNSLQEERDELYAQKANLVEACSSLESDLKEYQEKYVKKVETMLHDAEDRCKKYERENTELKERLHENEYK
ncbi:hypothetical protein [Encephalitozoon cuniculi GB-M1]|uniref:Uncharacterized protein n=1 Tax=Encephalitozoon cuniculi (strain GB-M1) TaxID=284813 RepID=Q8STK9_ENCCU|nr:uncharacterized protein ECU09_1900 [Encephalitozoon cuniculi GB-M1]UYI26889.1 Rab GTPase-activating protein [Encephalitozoon cuniculi]CAD27163.1 hypothetical protein [Encephalitozoon cuniculi GB-M1]